MPTNLAKESALVLCYLTDNHHSGQYTHLWIYSCLVLYFLLVIKYIIRNGEYEICLY